MTALGLSMIVLVSVAARAWVAMVGTGAVVLVTAAMVTAEWHRPSDARDGIALTVI